MKNEYNLFKNFKSIPKERKEESQNQKLKLELKLEFLGDCEINDNEEKLFIYHQKICDFIFQRNIEYQKEKQFPNFLMFPMMNCNSENLQDLIDWNFIDIIIETQISLNFSEQVKNYTTKSFFVKGETHGFFVPQYFEKSNEFYCYQCFLYPNFFDIVYKTNENMNPNLRVMSKKQFQIFPISCQFYNSLLLVQSIIYKLIYMK